MDLSGWLNAIKAMTPEQIQKMKDTFLEFSRLKGICVGKGWIIIDKGMTQIQVLQNEPEVKALHDVFIKVQPQGVKFIDKNGKILFDHPIDKVPKKRKTK